MGMRTPETYWAVFKRQAINLRICCNLLVDSVESMMMRGLAYSEGRFTHSMPCPCRSPAMPSAKGLECVLPIWFTQCGRDWFTLAMPRPCHSLTMPFFWRARHSTTVERRPEGYPPAFGFFRLPRGVPRRLLSEAYQSSSQLSIPTTVKIGNKTLQKGRSVKLLD
jgi:hypothetical protein